MLQFQGQCETRRCCARQVVYTTRFGHVPIRVAICTEYDCIQKCTFGAMRRYPSGEGIRLISVNAGGSIPPLRTCYIAILPPLLYNNIKLLYVFVV